MRGGNELKVFGLYRFWVIRLQELSKPDMNALMLHGFLDTRVSDR
jgi:hypothetical protein